MLRTIALCLAAACAATVFTAQDVNAQNIRTVRVATGLSLPVYVTAPPGDTSRLFIVEQRGNGGVASRGAIRILDLTTNPPTLLPTPFLSITGVSTSDEQGLLGLAFHPDYATNRTFFVYYTNPSTQIVRYKASIADPNIADPASATTILSFSQTFSNHNGGWIGFGPDGYLYISTGDGGSANDPNNAGQTLTTLLGKVLRISVSDTGTYTVPATNPFPGATAPFNTIWAYGLRNPWRASFDRQTGDFFIGDVGQSAPSGREEINFQPADVNGSMGGRNYGWRCMAGTGCTGLSGCTCGAANLITSIHDYGTGSLSRCTVIGGYVYRGSALPSLQGHFFFADYRCNNTALAPIYSLVYTGSPNPPVTERTASLNPSAEGITLARITSFGEDAAGELYIVTRFNGIFKIVPAPPSNNTCGGAPIIGAGTQQIDTTFATTTGPDEPKGCGFTGVTQISNDVWYQYLAQCDGVATVSVCNADFDTRIAVYASCPGGPGQAIACNDDFCGDGSQVTFPVQSGTLYRVRVGGNDAAGTGDLVISCGQPAPCPGDISGDNSVGVPDLLSVINNWGPCPVPPATCDADIAPDGGDGNVGVPDLLAVINGWGPCP